MVAPAIDPPAASHAAPSHAPSAPPAGVVRRGLVWAFRRLVGIYFRDIEATGNVPAEDTGGRLFVANHTNGLVDPILVLTTVPCAVSPIAKSTLWKIPGLRWLLDAGGAVPIQRRRDDPTKQAGSNEEVFDKIAGWLAGGGNVLIFPEGTSHNEPRLLEVKSGAARMLSRARDRGGRGLTLQAVGLEFEERDTFRSRCLILYGPVRSIDEIAIAPARAGKSELAGEELVVAVTQVLRDDLSELLVEGATWPERLLIARVAEMLTNDTGDRTMERWNSVGRQVEAARTALRDTDEATVEAIGDAVGRYYERLEEEGLADEQLAGEGDPRKANTLADAALLLSLPLAAAGMALYAVPYQLTRFAAERIAKDPDELSTYKLGVGMIAYPVWAAGVIGAGAVLTPPPVAAGIAAVTLASPFAALAWRDAAPRLRRSIRFATRAERLAELRRLRGEAMTLIQATRDRLGL